MKITFLGGGNMANALIGGMLKQGFAPADIAVVEPGRDARDRASGVCGQLPGIGGNARRRPAISWSWRSSRSRCGTPSLRSSASSAMPLSSASPPVCGMAALSRWLGGHRRIVRSMPNTPALIGAGITGLCALPEVDAAGRAAAERVLRAVGSTVWIDDEERMDAVTAISGSGPAYVFLFIEALQQAAADLGFTPEQGRQLAIGTVQGAAALAAQSSEPASVLRERVTSNGGTTEAALRTMAERGVKEGIIAGVMAAERRGRELGAILGAN